MDRRPQVQLTATPSTTYTCEGLGGMYYVDHIANEKGRNAEDSPVVLIVVLGARCAGRLTICFLQGGPVIDAKKQLSEPCARGHQGRQRCGGCSRRTLQAQSEQDDRCETASM